MTAVGLACFSALLFGAMSVGLRISLTRHPDAILWFRAAAQLLAMIALAVGLRAHRHDFIVWHCGEQNGK